MASSPLGAFNTKPYNHPAFPSAPIGQQIPPPVPGGTKAYYYESTLGLAPYNMVGFSNITPPAQYPGGGVVLVPDSDNGRMKILCWWPNSNAISLTRISEEGEDSPVRGGTPVDLHGRKTRTNNVQNPTAFVSLNGYVPMGVSNLTRVTGQPTARGTAVRSTATGSGTIGSSIPVQFPSSTEDQHTITASLYISYAAPSVTITFVWLNSTGGTISTNNVALTANEINQVVNRWDTFTKTVNVPSNAVNVAYRISATGATSGRFIQMTDLVYEAGATSEGFADGGLLGGQWLGTDHLSASVIAPVLTVFDGECPFDTNITYQVTSTTVIGGRITSDPAVLNSRNRTWLTDPERPDQPFRIMPIKPPTITYPIDRGIHQPYGRRTAVAISTRRRAAEGSLTLGTETFEERDTLLDSLDPGYPLLLRAPRNFGKPWSGGMWLSFGDIEEDPDDKPIPTQPRALTGEFVQVDAPTSNLLI